MNQKHNQQPNLPQKNSSAGIADIVAENSLIGIAADSSLCSAAVNTDADANANVNTGANANVAVNATAEANTDATVNSSNQAPLCAIKIGSVNLKSRVMLAPMAGITDMPYRQLIRRFSPHSLLTTEMISSEMLMQNRKDGDQILVNRENEFPLSYQLSGHKPEMMANAAKKLEKLERKPSIIDINMGCPVKKVVGGGDGSALMKTPQLASDIVKAVKDAVDLPVTVKFRLGYTAAEQNFMEFAKLMQDSGADAITIHCRTRSQMYSGNADWNAISGIKKEISIPVFANGDINTPQQAKECLEITGVDGIAVARGTLGAPDLIHRIEHFLATGELKEEADIFEKIEWAKDHLDDEMRLRGEKGALPFMRKFYPYYIRGVRNAAQERSRLMTCERYVKIMNYLNSICENEKNYH